MSWDFELRALKYRLRLIVFHKITIFCSWLMRGKVPIFCHDFSLPRTELGPLLNNSLKSPTSRGHLCRVAVCCKSSPKAQWTESNFLLLKLVSLWSQRDLLSVLWGIMTFVFSSSFVVRLPFSPRHTSRIYAFKGLFCGFSELKVHKQYQF